MSYSQLQELWLILPQVKLCNLPRQSRRHILRPVPLQGLLSMPVPGQPMSAHLAAVVKLQKGIPTMHTPSHVRMTLELSDREHRNAVTNVLEAAKHCRTHTGCAAPATP